LSTRPRVLCCDGIAERGIEILREVAEVDVEPKGLAGDNLHARLAPGQQIKLVAESSPPAPASRDASSSMDGAGPVLALVIGETPKDRHKRPRAPAPSEPSTPP